MPCATAASEELNRSRYEKRSLRWIGTDPEKVACVAARSIIEITREVNYLSGKKKGLETKETLYYVSSHEMVPERAREMLELIRKYWAIEGLLHQSLDVSAREDESRVKNRNALLILGIARRSVIGLKKDWVPLQRNQRKTMMNDFYDAMSKNNQRQAFSLFNKTV